MPSYKISLRILHDKQRQFVESEAKRKVIRAGRRGGKTMGIAQLAARYFLNNKRVLYAAPTGDQIEAFWSEIKRIFAEPLADSASGLLKNETRHTIQRGNTPNRIRAKTAWNADTMRSDYADLLIMDEWQLMNEEAWERVGAPMLMDKDGDAVFIYTPPSLHSRSVSKARDIRHAAKLFKAAKEDETGLWETFHFSSYDNPFLPETALKRLTGDMTQLAIRQEIQALDLDEDPRALWKRRHIQRITEVPFGVRLTRVVVGVDPPGGRAECGIVCAALGEDGNYYVLDDKSLAASPNIWGAEAVTAYNMNLADLIVAEKNYGGDMVEMVLDSQPGYTNFRLVSAARGKAIRAEPIAALYEQGKVFHMGQFQDLEEEMCSWVPDMGMASPNRIDALVWAMTELSVGTAQIQLFDNPLADWRG